MNGASLYVVACAAGPAASVGDLVALAQDDGWDVQLIATPAGAEFLDLDSLGTLTGHPVRTHYRLPGSPRAQRPPADAVIVAPATFNTVNKLAAGIADTYALGVVAELIGVGIPIVVLPFLSTAFADREPMRTSVARLRQEGVAVLLGPDGYEPHPPGVGETRIDQFPWRRALDEVKRLMSGS